MAGDFGFDANIILSGPKMAQEYAAADEARAQAGLASAKAAQSNYDLQRQQSLRDITKQNPGNYTDPTAQSLASGGFVDEANSLEQQATQRQVNAQKLMQLHADITRSRLASVSTPEQYDQIVSTMPDDVRARYSLPDQYDPQAVQQFVASGMAPEQQAPYLEAQRKRTALNDPDSPTYRAQAAFLEKLGIPIEPGMNLNDVSDKAEGVAEKLAAAQLIAGSRETVAQTNADAKKAVAKTRGSGTGAPIDDDSLNFEADSYARNNKFVNSGRGAQALAHNQAVIKRALERHPDMDPIAAAAALRASSKSLDHTQTQADAIGSFTKTFDKNIGILEDSLKDLPSSDNALINKGYRAWQGTVGSPELTTFQNALNTVRSELGKINSGSTGAGGVPMTLLQEMEHGLPNGATPAQVVAALKVYRKDSENRRAALNETLGDIQGRISGKGQGSTKSDASPAAGGTVTIRRTKDGLTKTLSAAAAAKYLADPGYEKVP